MTLVQVLIELEKRRKKCDTHRITYTFNNQERSLCLYDITKECCLWINDVFEGFIDYSRFIENLQFVEDNNGKMDYKVY